MNQNELNRPKTLEEMMKDWFLGMSSGDIQRVLRDIPREKLITAMYSWDTEFRDLIIRNLPRLVKEEIILGIEANNLEYSNEKVEEANKLIEKTVQRLEDCSEIHIRDIHK